MTQSVIQLMNQLINDKGVCRAALALPGSANNYVSWNLLISSIRLNILIFCQIQLKIKTLRQETWFMLALLGLCKLLPVICEKRLLMFVYLQLLFQNKFKLYKYLLNKETK